MNQPPKQPGPSGTVVQPGQPGQPVRPGGKVLVVGAGNIGSQLCPLLARLPAVSEVTIVDSDRYSAGNIQCQNIAPDDVHQLKAVAMAERLRRLRPDLRVSALVSRVEDVPLGRMRCDVMCACVDSRLSRLRVSEAAWRLAISLVDAGINGTAALARVNTYVPAAEAPCLQCGWSQKDYECLPYEYACDGSPREAPPSGAPATLGALAAAWQCMEVEKILAGDFGGALAGRQLLVGPRHYKHYVSTLLRRPDCRFDHRVWPIERLALASAKVAGLLDAARGLFPGRPDAIHVAVVGHGWVTRLGCESCGAQAATFRLKRRSPASCPDCPCRQCGAAMRPLPFYEVPRLDLLHPPDGLPEHTLGELGLLGGDVLRVVAAGPEAGEPREPRERFVELAELPGPTGERGD